MRWNKLKEIFLQSKYLKKKIYKIVFSLETREFVDVS